MEREPLARVVETVDGYFSIKFGEWVCPIKHNCLYNAKTHLPLKEINAAASSWLEVARKNWAKKNVTECLSCGLSVSVSSLVNEAVDAERERCAKIAENHMRKGFGTTHIVGERIASDAIAAAIRSTPGQP